MEVCMRACLCMGRGRVWAPVFLQKYAYAHMHVRMSVLQTHPCTCTFAISKSPADDEDLTVC